MGMDNQECELGLVCVSMPLYTYSGSIIAGLSVFGDSALSSRYPGSIKSLYSNTAPYFSARSRLRLMLELSGMISYSLFLSVIFNLIYERTVYFQEIFILLTKISAQVR